MVDADVCGGMTCGLQPAVDLPALLELVRWLNEDHGAGLYIELLQGNFSTEVFAFCQERSMKRPAHDRWPLFGPWFDWQTLPEEIRQRVLDVLTALCLETVDSPDGEVKTAVTAVILYSWMASRVLQGKLLGTDATGVRVLEPGTGQAQKGTVWVYCGQREVCPYLIYEYTRTGDGDLMGRHRAMSEGIVNNLMNHQGVRYAKWKGLALARVQVGLAVVMLNTLKWHKIVHDHLQPMTLKPAA